MEKPGLASVQGFKQVTLCVPLDRTICSSGAPGHLTVRVRPNVVIAYWLTSSDVTRGSVPKSLNLTLQCLISIRLLVIRPRAHCILDGPYCAPSTQTAGA